MVNNKINFKNEEHKKYYELFKLKANMQEGDKQRKALFYLLALLEKTRENINEIYNFDKGYIYTECLDSAWQTGTTLKVIKLAFNLYNGFTCKDDFSPVALFSVDYDLIEYLLEAIRIRF